MARFLKPSLLVIAELGYLPIDRFGADGLFQVISERYERGSSVITTHFELLSLAAVTRSHKPAASIVNSLRLVQKVG